MNVIRKNLDEQKKHIEEMASFRRTHPRLTPSEPAKPQRAILHTRTFIAPYQADSANFLTDDNGNSIVVPLWDITLPGDSQN